MDLVVLKVHLLLLQCIHCFGILTHCPSARFTDIELKTGKLLEISVFLVSDVSKWSLNFCTEVLMQLTLFGLCLTSLDVFTCVRWVINSLDLPGLAVFSLLRVCRSWFRSSHDSVQNVANIPPN